MSYMVSLIILVEFHLVITRLTVSIMESGIVSTIESE